MFITYPPIVDSSIPAFVYTEKEIKIKFDLPKTVNKNEIKNIGVKITNQFTNKSVVDVNKYWDGIVYVEPSLEGDKDKYFITINSKSISIPNKSGFKTWVPNQYYKVQICFSYGQKYQDYFLTNKADFFKWKKSQVMMQNFSEWSSVIVIKAIYKPTVQILNNKGGIELNSDVISGASETTESSLFPQFEGIYNNDKSEPLDKYRFILYEGLQTEDPLYETEWLQSNNSAGALSLAEDRQLITSLETYSFSHILLEDTLYTLKFQTLSMNGYFAEAEPYSFRIILNYLDSIDGIKIIVHDTYKDDDPYYNENACFDISLMRFSEIIDDVPQHPGVLNGVYYIRRSDEHSNFTEWQDLAKLVFYNNNDIPADEERLVYQDFTIESGVKYVYSLEYCNPSGLRSIPLFENNANYKNIPYHICDFENSYFYHEGIQLKLTYDVKLQNVKNTTLAVKQDTLNSKYPLILRNALANYKEFQISGRLSFINDNDETFLYEDRYKQGYFFQDQLIIPEERYLKDAPRTETTKATYETEANLSEYEKKLSKFQNGNLNRVTNNNIFIEKKYRDLAYDFLNNGDYKLFKSSTEGNIIVSLINVNLTPEEKLSRMIYNFSATAYEVMDCTLLNMQEYSINSLDNCSKINKVKNENRFDEFSNTSLFVGQIRGAYIGNHERYRHPELANTNEALAPINYKDYVNNGANDKDVTQYNYSIGSGIEGFSYLSRVNINEKNPFLPENMGTYNPAFDKRDNLYELVKIQCKQIISDDHEYVLKRIKGFWVEAYPEIDLKDAIFALEKEEPNPRFIYQHKHWEEERNRLLKLQTELKLPQSNLVTFIIDGQREINVYPNRVYMLNDFDIMNSLYLKTTRAVIFNYIAEIIQVENLQDSVTYSSVVYPVGQLSGIFTNSLENAFAGNQDYLMATWISKGGTKNDPYMIQWEKQRNDTVLGDGDLETTFCSQSDLDYVFTQAAKANSYAIGLCSDVCEKNVPGFLRIHVEAVKSKTYVTKTRPELIKNFNTYLVPNPELKPRPPYNSEDILDNYDLYRSKNLYAVAENDTKINGHERYNYNLYQTTDIYAIIQQRSRLEIEKGYLSANPPEGEEIKDYEQLSNYFYSEDYNNNENLPWKNKDENIPGEYLEYVFKDIDFIEIEADANTELILKVRVALDKPVQEKRVRIGPTEKYILNKFNDTNIIGLRFAKPTHAVINYKSRCILRVKGRD